jgi:DNA-binding CsgD family transcriptional regulator
MGRHAEAVEVASQGLVMAREIAYPLGEVSSLGDLAVIALHAGDADRAVRLARQAWQLTAAVPGLVARWCSYLLVGPLFEAGELAAAQALCAAALAQARDVGDQWNQTGLLAQMVILDLEAGRLQDAAAHLREGLRLDTRIGKWREFCNGLDCCGLLCAATGRPAEAVTVWAARAAHLRHYEVRDSLEGAHRREEPLCQARQVLGPGQARAAEQRGAAMSRDTAAEYALMLTDPAPPEAAATSGRLSARERELVALVARGRTDAEIAAELYISIRTVRSHLDRIRDKTGCRRRVDLTRLALSTGLV